MILYQYLRPCFINIYYSEGDRQENIRAAYEWGIFANDMSKKGLISQIYKDIIQFNSKKKKKDFDLELSRETKQPFFQRRYTVGQ